MLQRKITGMVANRGATSSKLIVQTYADPRPVWWGLLPPPNQRYTIWHAKTNASSRLKLTLIKSKCVLENTLIVMAMEDLIQEIPAIRLVSSQRKTNGTSLLKECQLILLDLNCKQVLLISSRTATRSEWHARKARISLSTRWPKEDLSALMVQNSMELSRRKNALKWLTSQKSPRTALKVKEHLLTVHSRKDANAAAKALVKWRD